MSGWCVVPLPPLTVWSRSRGGAQSLLALGVYVWTVLLTTVFGNCSIMFTPFFYKGRLIGWKWNLNFFGGSDARFFRCFQRHS